MNCLFIASPLAKLDMCFGFPIPGPLALFTDWQGRVIQASIKYHATVEAIFQPAQTHYSYLPLFSILVLFPLGRAGDQVSDSPGKISTVGAAVVDNGFLKLGSK